MFQQFLTRRFVKSVLTHFQVNTESLPTFPSAGAMAQEDGFWVLYVNESAAPVDQDELVLLEAARLALGYSMYKARTPASLQLVERHVTALAARWAVEEHLLDLAHHNGLSPSTVARLAGTTERLARFAMENRQLVYTTLDAIVKQNPTYRAVIVSSWLNGMAAV